MVPARARPARSRAGPLTGRRYIDLFTVGGTLGEVDARCIGRCSEAAGRSDGLSVAIPKMQMVETGPHNGAGHIDDKLAGRRSAMEASMAT